MGKKLLLFACFILALALVNILGAGVFGAIGYIAQLWLEFFSGSGYEEIAILGAVMIGIVGFVTVIVYINRIALWWRLRKIQRLHL